MPIFGWGLWLMGMILIRRDWTKDKVGVFLVMSAKDQARLFQDNQEQEASMDCSIL
jgi:1-acyl-sn-glycerol-3-phosphate acyltransferase